VGLTQESLINRSQLVVIRERSHEPNEGETKPGEVALPSRIAEGAYDSIGMPHLDTGSMPTTKPRLVYASTIGLPTIVLDPEDLLPCPTGMEARIQRVDDDTIVKFGRDVRLAEAAAMRLVSTKTSIIVPEVKSAYILDDIGYIIMSYEPGLSLFACWPMATTDMRTTIIAQMKDHISQLRSVKSDFFGSVDGSACAGEVFKQHWFDPFHAYGPYCSEQDFNNGLCETIMDRLPPDIRKLRDLLPGDGGIEQSIRSLHGHETVLTHGDLNSGNVLVRPNGTLVLLDWGSAGYMPDYWEYCRAKFNPWTDDWDEKIDVFMKPCEEFEIMRKYFYLMVN